MFLLCQQRNLLSSIFSIWQKCLLVLPKLRFWCCHQSRFDVASSNVLFWVRIPLMTLMSFSRAIIYSCVARTHVGVDICRVLVLLELTFLSCQNSISHCVSLTHAVSWARIPVVTLVSFGRIITQVLVLSELTFGCCQNRYALVMPELTKLCCQN